MKKASKNIAILTGAGISAESGISTFRTKGGIWEKYNIEDVATLDAFLKNPKLVHEFYNLRRGQILNVLPNKAHIALAKLEKEYPGHVTIITQNIDDLHERGGSKNVIHMHGEIFKSRCHFCGNIVPCIKDLSIEEKCMKCKKIGLIRPHIVWFGEIPLEMDKIYEEIESCQMFVAIGTSSIVQPAASFVLFAKESGAKTVEINLEKTAMSDYFDRSIFGMASEKVPQAVDQILGEK